MSRLFWSTAVALGALLMMTGLANAERVPSSKVATPVETGARPDITVPYITNGRSTLGVYNGVSPAIVAKPGLGGYQDAQVRPVYNLPYYGSQQYFNSGFFGAMDRPPNQLRPRR
jgi:hypothetical protein